MYLPVFPGISLPGCGVRDGSHQIYPEISRILRYTNRNRKRAQAMSALLELSTALADAVETVTPSLVYVDARRGYGATGLAWKPEGLVVTASHVVQREDEITVFVNGSHSISAELVGRDGRTDIAVLRFNGSLQSVVQPSSDAARVGNLVLALGTNAREPAAASFGVVSTINRPWRSSRGQSIDELLRSDVTLYPGFSGGPLVDARGQVLGMNTSALTRGLAATIPWSIVARIAETLISEGSIKRGYLGIVSQPVEIPGQLRETCNVQQETGLLVVAVELDSPAGIAGVMIGDILVQIDDQTITGVEDLQEWLASATVGDAVELTVIRGGARVNVSITVGAR
jgi:S1-C subfamily serine protease